MTENLELDQFQRFLSDFKTIDVAVYSYTTDEGLEMEDFFITDGMEKIFDRSIKGFDATAWRRAIHPLDRKKVFRWKKQMHSKQEAGFIQYRITHTDGSVHWVEDHLTPKVGIGDSPKVFFGIIIEITAKKEYEQQIEYMAFYDNLTGIPNRNLLKSYAPKAIARCKRKGTGLAIMYVDLDKFKIVNDTYGHEIGDILLQQVAGRLTECVRKGDIISRQGGDEFIILLEDTDTDKVQVIAERIINRVSEHFLIDHKEIHISASIGISLCPQDAEDLDTLIRLADEAMYQCKASSLYQFYKTH